MVEKKVKRTWEPTPREPAFGPGELPVDYEVKTYDKIEVGEEFGPVEFVISQQTHDKHTEMIQLEGRHPWYLEDSPWGGIIVWPFEQWGCPRTTSRYWGRGSGSDSVLVGIEWEFYKPPKVGQKQIGYARTHSKYYKRGRPYYKFEYWVEDEDGDILAKGIDEMLITAELPPELMKLR